MKEQNTIIQLNLRLAHCLAISRAEFSRLQTALRDGAWVVDKINNRAQFWVVLVCLNPAIAVGKTYADSPIQKCLGASCRSRELIGFVDREVMGPYMNASLVDLVENLSGCEGRNPGVETKVIRWMGEFISKLIPEAEASRKFKR